MVSDKYEICRGRYLWSPKHLMRRMCSIVNWREINNCRLSAEEITIRLPVPPLTNGNNYEKTFALKIFGSYRHTHFNTTSDKIDKMTNTIIKPHECGFWGSRNTRVVFFCSLINLTSVVLYLSHATKTTEKQLLITEFHTPSSPWRRDDVTPTSRRAVQQYAWHHWESRRHWCNREIRITRMLYLIFLYHARIPRLDRRTPRGKFF
jgi:hypothetical protein